MIDRMFIIFPFEVDFYKKHGISVEYYGNPLVDETEKRIALFLQKMRYSNPSELKISRLLPCLQEAAGMRLKCPSADDKGCQTLS